MKDHRCSNLVEWVDGVILLCDENGGYYVPEQSHIKQYCKNKQNSKCPYHTACADQ